MNSPSPFLSESVGMAQQDVGQCALLFARVRWQVALPLPHRSEAKAGYGSSSIGRVAVSKTVGWGFNSLLPCQLWLARCEVKAGLPTVALAKVGEVGEVAEWSIAAVLKTALA